MDRKSENVQWQSSLVDRKSREALLRQRGCVIWLTGLSGSGKTTLANAMESKLVGKGHAAFVLDGDNVRHGLCSDLGFSIEERTENIRRIGSVAALMADAGLIVFCAFISPLAAQRAMAQKIVGDDRFFEVHLATALSVCEARDPKGLYAQARRGEIESFTGIGADYDEPVNPSLVVDTEALSPEESLDALMGLLADNGILGH